jgi:phosphoglycolate phosphatase-like HAD superfamily hydrolase
MKPLYIFDLDGTLADAEHRLHHIQGAQKNWPAFFAACADDKPIQPVIRTLKGLVRSGEVWIWTGRSDEVRNQTTKWIHDHVGAFHSFWNPMRVPEALMMRPAGDHQPDHKLKYGWLANLEPPERNRLTAVFEDRDQVVQMWRDAGVQCFQVAPGAF